MRRVTIGGVSEYVARVMGDDVQDHVNPLLVSGLDKVSKLGASSEMRINVEEVLDAVAVVAWLEGDLPEDGTDPESRDSEPAKVAELALQPGQGSSLPFTA